MIVAGSLTEAEALRVQTNCEERLAKLDQEMAQCNQEKKLAKLTQQREVVQGKLAGVATALASPVVFALKGAPQIEAVKLQLLELEAIAAAKGLQDISTVKKLAQQGPLEDELRGLLEDAKEWFQEEEDHQAKVEAVFAVAQKRYKQAQSKKKDDGWSTASKRGR